MKRYITILMASVSYLWANGQEHADTLSYSNESQTVTVDSQGYERDTFFEDGKCWKYCQKDGIAIYESCEKVRDYGKWHRVHIEIVNDTSSPIEFDPNQMKAYGYNNDDKTHRLEVWSHKDYMKRVRRINLWTTIAVVVGEVASDISMESSHAHHYESRGGRHHGPRHQHINPAIIAHHHAVSALRVAGLGLALAGEYEMRDEGYMRRTTIYPGEAVSGYINIERDNERYMDNKIMIGDTPYEFSW